MAKEKTHYFFDLGYMSSVLKTKTTQEILRASQYKQVDQNNQNLQLCICLCRENLVDLLHSVLLVGFNILLTPRG